MKLPYPGGWDNNGVLTSDPKVIISNEKALPIGYWKGSGLSIVLDLLAALLSKGDPTCRIGIRGDEYGLSQVFIALNIKWFDHEYVDNLIEEIIQNVHSSKPLKEGENVFYPGERTIKTRMENQKLGVPVHVETWQKILNL